MSPAPAAALLAAVATAAFLTDRVWALALMAGVLLVVCLRAPVARRWPYLAGAILSGLTVFLISPLLWSSGGGTLVWEGPTIPVLGPIDVSTDEIQIAALNGLRLTAVGLAFSAFALLLDHDRLVSSAGFARRSALAVALATRLVPTLERDASGPLRSGAGSRCPAVGAARLCDAAVAARRGLARTGLEPGGGDGGQRVRAAGLEPRPAPAVVAPRPGRAGSRRPPRGRGCRVALARVERLSFAYPDGPPVPAGRVARAAGGRGRCTPRPVRLRKVDAAARARRTRAAFPRGSLFGGVEVGGLDTRVARPAESPGRWRRCSRIRRTRW